MRILVVGDLHGQVPIIPKKSFDAVIAPGDFCSDKLKTYQMRQVRQVINSQKVVAWYDQVGRQRAKAMIRKSLADGRAVLERLNKLEVPVYVIPGNWDWTAEPEGWNFLRKDNYKLLLKDLKNVRDCSNKIVDAGSFRIIGYGESSGPEYYEAKRAAKLPRARRKRHDAYRAKLQKPFNALFNRARKPVIFLTHNVPYNTKLDLINNKQSPRDGEHFGSILARDMVLKHKPLLCIGAHIHENYGTTRLGKTVCLNAGFGKRVYTIVQIENSKLKVSLSTGRKLRDKH